MVMCGVCACWQCLYNVSAHGKIGESRISLIIFKGKFDKGYLYDEDSEYVEYCCVFRGILCVILWYVVALLCCNFWF